jgi:flavodoxin short chain
LKTERILVMRKLVIVYWSGTGNTEAMAVMIAEGAKDAGADVTVLTAGDFSADQVAGYDLIAFGCPSMGAEELEETEFEPMFASLEGLLSGKSIALFGSYGWGDGQWMRDWEERCEAAGAVLYTGKGLIVNETPVGTICDACREFGRGFAKI